MSKRKYIETPEALLELFERYVKDVKGKPRLKHVFVGKFGESKHEELERPLTMAGFEVFCFEQVGTVEHYFRNDKGNYDDYCTICSHIKKRIRQDQIEGGSVGQYNASITQRLNGLSENIKQEINVEQPLFPDTKSDND
jgi:hypothetical protein